MGKNTTAINPHSNSQVFGQIPEIKVKKFLFQSGPIFLKEGIHRRGSGAFGIKHILGRHKKDLINQGYCERCEKSGAMLVPYEMVSRYVADIIRPNSTLHSDFENIAGSKIQISKRGVGIAVVQAKTDGAGNCFYSVVTAYPGQAKGSKFGALAE